MRLIGKIDGCKQETYKEWQIQQHCRKTLYIFNVGSYYLLIAKNSASLSNNFFKKRLHIETTRILLLYIYRYKCKILYFRQIVFSATGSSVKLSVSQIMVRQNVLRQNVRVPYVQIVFPFGKCTVIYISLGLNHLLACLCYITFHNLPPWNNILILICLPYLPCRLLIVFAPSLFSVIHTV